MTDFLAEFTELCATDVAVLEQPEVHGWVRRSAALRAHLESFDVRCARRLEELAVGSPLGLSAEQAWAGAARVSSREASTTLARAAALEEVPALEAALRDGAVTGAHVDVVARAIKDLGDDAAALTAQGDWLLQLATVCTPEQFASSVRREVRRLHDDGGLSVFELQRRRMFLRHWTDGESGMVCLRGEFDPESGARLVGRLNAAVERLFHAGTPDTCPTGRDKQQHLRALALLDLTAGSGSGPGRSEISIVIDYETMLNGVHERSMISNDHDIELCVATIRRIACESFIYPVVLDGDSVMLDLGRGQRLASSHQRRALRVLYRHCGWPGCSVLVKDTEPHHINPWAAGGPTDLDDLVPLCARHHHAVHEGGWRVERDANTRNHRFISPHGEILTTGPPNPRPP